MEVELKAGARLDLASGAELREQTRQLRAALAAQSDPTIVIPTQGFAADSAGNVGGGVNGAGFVLVQAPMGQSLKLHRWGLTAQGFNAGAPLNTAGAWLQFYRNAATPTGLVMLLPAGGAVAPAVITEGQHDAVLLRKGDTLVVIGGGFAALQPFGISFQAQLLDNPTGIEQDPDSPQNTPGGDT